MTINRYLSNILSALSQLLNTLLGGEFTNETLSARAYRTKNEPLERAINILLLDDEHCRKEFEDDFKQSVIYAEANKLL